MAIGCNSRIIMSTFSGMVGPWVEGTVNSEGILNSMIDGREDVLMESEARRVGVRVGVMFLRRRISGEGRKMREFLSTEGLFIGLRRGDKEDR